MRTVQPLVLKRYVYGLAAGWTVVIATLCSVNILQQRAQTLEMARTEARSNFQRDLSYRRWNAASGNVYVEVSKDTPPNPFLPKTPERDLTTTNGRHLTQVNPAYMSRLVFELAARNHEVQGHIASLRPVRPGNFADPWEKKALLAFERGEKEISSVERIGERSYLRLMSPLITTPECLKCHAKDGYRVGDVRGGISVAVPMEPLSKIFTENVILGVGTFTLLWVTGLAGIVMGGMHLRKTMRERDAAEQGVAELNEDLLSLTAELREANEELEGFCAAVSHDLRSPLAVIGGYSQLIQQSGSDRDHESCIRFAGIVHRETSRMDRMIGTMLNFSRLTRGAMKHEVVDLSRVAEAVVSALSIAAPDRYVDIRITEKLRAEGDPELLRVVLQNLLGNAWKYTEKREHPVIELGAGSNGKEKFFFVRDNGIGFDEEESARIFSPFTRLGNAVNYEGTGVGLATVKRIVTRHGGRIWCNAEPGRGATFSFTIPSCLAEGEALTIVA